MKIKLFKMQFKPNMDTVYAIILGSVIITLSYFLSFSTNQEIIDKTLFFIIRDILMIFICGFIIPVCYVTLYKKESLEGLGITKKYWKVSLIINILLGGMLLISSLTEPGAEKHVLTLTCTSAGQLFYYIFIGIFEVLVFYGFMREKFEKAFGIIPAILLTAAFYSIHHISLVESGNYIELFFVGIMYCAVYRITKNVLIIFPFFWFVGACKEIMLGMETPIERLNARGDWTRGSILCVLIIVSTFLIWKKVKKREEVDGKADNN